MAVDVAMFSSHSRQSPLFSIFQLKLGSVAIVSGAARGSERPTSSVSATDSSSSLHLEAAKCSKMFEGF